MFSPTCHLCWWRSRLSQCSPSGLFSSVTQAWLWKPHHAGSCLPIMPISLEAGCSCTGRVAMRCSAVACLSLWAQSALLCAATELVTAPEAFWWHGELWNCVQLPLRVAWHHLSARWGHKQSPARTLPIAAFLLLHSNLCREMWAGWTLPLGHPDQPSLDLHRTLPFCPWIQPKCCLLGHLDRTPVPLTGSSDVFSMSLEASHPQVNSSWSQVFDTLSIWMH